MSSQRLLFSSVKGKEIIKGTSGEGAVSAAIQKFLGYLYYPLLCTTLYKYINISLLCPITCNNSKPPVRKVILSPSSFLPLKSSVLLWTVRWQIYSVKGQRVSILSFMTPLLNSATTGQESHGQYTNKCMFPCSTETLCVDSEM